MKLIRRFPLSFLASFLFLHVAIAMGILPLLGIEAQTKVDFLHIFFTISMVVLAVLSETCAHKAFPVLLLFTGLLKTGYSLLFPTVQVLDYGNKMDRFLVNGYMSTQGNPDAILYYLEQILFVIGLVLLALFFYHLLKKINHALKDDPAYQAIQGEEEAALENRKHRDGTTMLDRAQQ